MAQGIDEEDSDDEDGWVDYREDMTDTERKELEESVAPMRLLLVKVSNITVSFSRHKLLI